MTLINRAIITAVAGLGLAIGGAAPASAERVWDVVAYDDCIFRIPTIIEPSDYNYSVWKCCTDSGGVFDFNQEKCVAPPAEADNVPGNPVAPGQPRPPAPGGTEGVSDDPQAGTPLPTPNPRPRPGAPTLGGIG